ncbi:MAG TPA: hypothetical protein VMF30_18950, partial [Pirellulales bacterium]|nr:hypothetical protein [Pirellulales bacterium]
ESRDDEGTHHFVEVGRDPERIELTDPQRGILVRLYHDRLMYRTTKQPAWVPMYNGGWEAAGTVTPLD